jgi:hypothetical protein
MQVASVHEALAMIAANNPPGAPFATIFTSTMPKLRRGSPYAAGVVHNASRAGQLGCSYESCVNRLLARQDAPDAGFFVADQLWRGKGAHLEGSRYLVRHIDTEQLYLCFRQSSVVWEQYLDAASGEPCDPTQWLYESVQRDDRVIWRTVKIENVLAIKVGEIYNIGD